MKKNIIDSLFCQGFDGHNFIDFSNEGSNQSVEDMAKGVCISKDIYRCKGSVANFFSRFHVIRLFGECGGYKKRGVPVAVILMYLFCKMFSPMSMYMEMKVGSFTESFSKNPVYDFLNNTKANWQLFLMRLSAVVCGAIASLTTSGDGRYAFIVDDTPLERRGKDIELVSWVFDHVKNHSMLGYHVLTLAWTDGVTTLPVRYSLIASANDDLVVGPIRDDIPKGSTATKIRKMARAGKPELTVDFLKDAIAAGIKAGAVVFDSWFSTTPLIY